MSTIVIYTANYKVTVHVLRISLHQFNAHMFHAYIYFHGLLDCDGANLAVSPHKQPKMAILPEVHMFAAKKPLQIRYRWKA